MEKDKAQLNNVIDINVILRHSVDHTIKNKSNPLSKIFSSKDANYIIAIFAQNMTVFNQDLSIKLEYKIPEKIEIGSMNAFSQSESFFVVGHSDGCISVFSSINQNKNAVFYGVAKISKKDTMISCITTIENYRKPNEFLVGNFSGDVFIFSFTIPSSIENNGVNFSYSTLNLIINNPMIKLGYDIQNIHYTDGYIYILASNSLIISKEGNKINYSNLIQPNNGILICGTQSVSFLGYVIVYYSYRIGTNQKKLFNIRFFEKGKEIPNKPELINFLQKCKEEEEIMIVPKYPKSLFLIKYKTYQKIAKAYIFYIGNDMLSLKSIKFDIPKFSNCSGYALFQKSSLFSISAKHQKTLIYEISINNDKWLSNIKKRQEIKTQLNIKQMAIDCSEISLNKSLECIGMECPAERRKSIYKIFSNYHLDIIEMCQNQNDITPLLYELYINTCFYDRFIHVFWDIIIDFFIKKKELKDIFINIYPPHKYPFIICMIKKSPLYVDSRFLDLLALTWKEAKIEGWKAKLSHFLMTIKFYKYQYSLLSEFALKNKLYQLYVHINVNLCHNYIEPINMLFKPIYILSYLWFLMKTDKDENKLSFIQRYELESNFDFKEVLDFYPIKIVAEKDKKILKEHQLTVITYLINNNVLSGNLLQYDSGKGVSYYYLGSLVCRAIIRHSPSTYSVLCKIFSCKQNLSRDSKYITVNIFYQFLVNYAIEENIPIPFGLYPNCLNYILFGSQMFSFPQNYKNNLLMLKQIDKEISIKKFFKLQTTSSFASKYQFVTSFYNFSNQHSICHELEDIEDMNINTKFIIFLESYSQSMIDTTYREIVENVGVLKVSTLYHHFFILLLNCSIFKEMINNYISNLTPNADSLIFKIGWKLCNFVRSTSIPEVNVIYEKLIFIYFSLFMEVDSNFVFRCHHSMVPFLHENISFFLEKYIFSLDYMKRDNSLRKILQQNNIISTKTKGISLIKDEKLVKKIKDHCYKYHHMKSLMFILDKEEPAEFFRVLGDFLFEELVILDEFSCSEDKSGFLKIIKRAELILSIAFAKLRKYQKSGNQSFLQFLIKTYEHLLNVFLPFLVKKNEKITREKKMIINFFECLTSNMILNRFSNYLHKIIDESLTNVTGWKFVHIIFSLMSTISEKFKHFKYTLNLYQIDEANRMSEATVFNTIGVSSRSKHLCDKCEKELSNSTFAVYFNCNHIFHLDCFFDKSERYKCPKCFDASKKKKKLHPNEGLDSSLANLKPPDNFAPYLIKKGLLVEAEEKISYLDYKKEKNYICMLKGDSHSNINSRSSSFQNLFQNKVDISLDSVPNFTSFLIV